MEKNITKLIDNGQELHRIDSKTVNLVNMASKFKGDAMNLRRKMEMKKFITMLVIVVVCFAILLALAFSSTSPEPTPESTRPSLPVNQTLPLVNKTRFL